MSSGVVLATLPVPKKLSPRLHHRSTRPAADVLSRATRMSTSFKSSSNMFRARTSFTKPLTAKLVIRVKPPPDADDQPSK